jgi:hypothetical protein
MFAEKVLNKTIINPHLHYKSNQLYFASDYDRDKHLLSF